MAKKAAEEAKYFWDMKRIFASSNSKSGTSKKVADLFGKKSGTVGINFKAYDQIKVVRSGENADDINALVKFSVRIIYFI